jgi:hypothetical protein
MSKNYTTKCGRFSVDFVATPQDMAGRMDPFTPYWNIQNLGDGTQEFFDTEEECKSWIKEWDDIG